MLEDLRYGIRMLRKAPGVTAVAVLSLALGIGVNTSIFSFADTLLFRPLPFPESDRLVSLYYRTADDGIYSSMSYPDYAYFRDHNDFLADLAAYDDVAVEMRFDGQAEKVYGEIVSWNYFSVLGVRPALGRAFLPDEDRTPGSHPLVVLSHGLWQRRFGGDRGVIGREVVIFRQSFTVIGVAPRGFQGFRLDRPARPEFWTPLMMYTAILPGMADWRLENRWTTHWLATFGRLKPGLPLAQAQAGMTALTARLKQDHWDREWKGFFEPRTGLLYSANETRFNPNYRGTVTTYLGLLTAVVGLVLLIACFNVANLAMARAAGRHREMAVRLSLGASRGRIVAQLLTESLLLSLMGGAVGLVVAIWTSEFLASFRQPFKVQLLLETGLDLRVLGFALALAALTGVLFGLAPARQASRVNLTGALKTESGSGAGSGGLGLRSGLVIAQVALSLLLLIGAGLFVRTLRNAQAADVTLDAGNVLLARLNLAAQKYNDTRGKLFYSQLLERIRPLPGVRDAALVMEVPLGGRRGGTNVIVDRAAKPIQVDFNVVTPDYFRTIGIPVVRGREFTNYDREDSPAVAVVNEQWVRRFWPGQDPVGKRFELEWGQRLVEVVGVVRDGKFRNYRANVYPCFYVPLAQDYQNEMNLEVRTAGDPTALAAAVRREIKALDKDFLLPDVTTLKAHRDAGIAQERLTAALLSALGALALVLAGIGVYGVMSFSVAQRTREIGIRMAMGARRADVVSLVIRRGLLLALAGLAIGLGGAFALTPLVANLLYGVTPADALTFAGASLLLIAVALVAVFLPARRAAGVDPIVCLRYE